jgi:hypothetical protein
MISVPNISFPFRRGSIYSIGALRDFERELLHARQNDPSLSAEWRVPKGEIRSWAKIREETYPLKLLADHQGLADDWRFRLMPEGYASPIDIELWRGEITRNLQITTADPIWQEGSNGGYDQRLVMEALNSGDAVHGIGAFMRTDGKIVAQVQCASIKDDWNACVAGLVAAFERKRGHAGNRCELVIFARSYHRNTIDIGFRNVVDAVIARIGRLHFEHIYIFDEDRTAFVEA